MGRHGFPPSRGAIVERRQFRSRVRSLVVEAHRRSLWQVLAVYAMASWVAFEAVVSLTEGIGLPIWVPGVALALLITGLPLVLATACVHEVPLASRPSDETATPPAAASPTVLPHRAPDGPSAEGTVDDAGGPARPDPDPPHAAAKRTPWRHLTWGRLGALGALALAALALVTGAWMGMRALGIGPMGTLVAKGELEAREPLMVADFEGLTGDSSLAVVVAEGLRADLAQSSFVTVADRGRVRETLALMLRPPDARLDAATAREAAVRMGLKAVVEGEVGRAGAGYLLTARVVTADSARTLASSPETANDSAALLPAIERLSRSIRERVGESLRTVAASVPLDRVMTPSLPALRKAAEGWQEQDRSNAPRAIRLMQQAVELDPEFASAWAGLAVLLYNRGDRDATLRSVREALDHEDRLSEVQRHSTRGLYASIVGDHRTSEAERMEVAALTPNDPRPYVLLSDATWNRGDWTAAAAHARRALDMGATTWVAHWNLVVALLDGGELAEARAASAAAAAALPPDHDIPRQLADMVLAQGFHYDSVHARDDPDWPGRAALADRVLGRWDEAERHYREVGDEIGARAWRAFDRMIVLGDPDATGWVVALVDSLIPVRPELPERQVAEFALAAAMVGRLDVARRARDVYLGKVPGEVRWSDAYILQAAEGFIALHEGRDEEALQALRRAREATPWTAPVDAFLGRAYDRLGVADSAIAAYTRYVETPWAYRIGFFATFADPVLLVPAFARLAELYEDGGDRASAARYASDVVRLWRGADPELQPLVAGARRILQRAAAERAGPDGGL
jgi:tetratricopeptide (TPR) repeat protein